MNVAPTEFFIFVNMLDDVTRANLTATKGFTSAGLVAACQDEKFRPLYEAGTAKYSYHERSSDFLSRRGAPLANDLLENDAERVRLGEFPLAPSRLSGLFAFDSMTECEKAVSVHGWDRNEIRRFTLIPHRWNRVIRVNMEIVTLMRGVYASGHSATTDTWRHYWSGRGKLTVGAHTSGEIWECIVEGRFQLVEPQ